MITTLYKTRAGTDPAATKLLMQLKQAGYGSLAAIRREFVLRVESKKPISQAQLTQLFCYPGLETATTAPELMSAEWPVIEVAYQRAITDPEMSSILHGAEALGIEEAQWARLATRYQFQGLSQVTAEEVVRKFLCNAQVETIIQPDETWNTLIPQGTSSEVELIDLAGMDDRALLALSEKRRLHMPLAQLQAVRAFFVKLGRPARDGEIETMAARWGDHCFHTTWKALGLLQALQQASGQICHPLVLSAFDDNSGVMGLYDGWALSVKGETHISPTFGGSPYGGIMTKHGGVIRDDTFNGQGGWPIAGTTIMATCDPHTTWDSVPTGAFHPQVVLRESIRGTCDYTNPMGIPMAAWQYLIHPNNWKGFALGHSVGIVPSERAQKGEPQTGDYVVLIGGPTGRDGLHGATVSSSRMTSQTATVDAAHVQIGIPIEERKFMEAIPVLRDADCIRACTDSGAAGLESAVGEMGSIKGVWINLAWVVLKCAGMARWEILLSESQERGVLAVPPLKLKQALEILAEYDVPASVIGVFTDTQSFQVIHDASLKLEDWQQDLNCELTGDVVVDLPYEFLNSGCPLPIITMEEPKKRPRRFTPPLPGSSSEWVQMIRMHLGHYNICDQSAAGHQYDQTVQGNTVLPCLGGKSENMPDELFAVVPVRGKPWTAGIANAVNQFYGEVNPAGMGRHVYTQAITKLVAAGFNPADISCCANVYSPSVLDNPTEAWKLVQLVKEGYIHASVDFGIPVISGKDSSSGTFIGANGERIDAPLTLDILAVGRMRHASVLIPKPFENPGDVLVLFHPGLTAGLIGFGGSIVADLYGERDDMLPLMNLKQLRSGWARYHQLVNGGWRLVRSRSAIAEGGLIRRLFEMSLGKGLGCSLNLPEKPLQWLFGEISGAILMAVDQRALSWCEKVLTDDYLVLGQVTEEPAISVNVGGKYLFSRHTADLMGPWSTTFTEVAL